jgi:hypothetical protein
MTTLADQLTPAPKFWSDDFDMDLLKVFPNLAPLLATVTRPLYVHGGQSFGRLNHPDVYNSYVGMLAFFSFSPACHHHHSKFYTSRPIIECTWAEAIRDAWPHTYVLNLDGQSVFDAQALHSKFELLMYDLRGWQKADAVELAFARSSVEESVLSATLAAERLSERYQ